MIIPTTIVSLVLLVIAFLITEKNAKYYLSGYNSMSKADQKKTDIKPYIQYFKRFHIFLGISLFVFTMLLTHFISENIGGIFLGIYPILAYLYFMLTSAQYSKGFTNRKNYKIGFIVLSAVLIFVIGLTGLGYKEDQLTFNSSQLSIEGIYGETLSANEIKSITLTPELPKISRKNNGFSLGSIKKGYFKTKDGPLVKLVLNNKNSPYILIEKANGKLIYFSAKDQENRGVFEEMKQRLKGVEFK